MTYDFERFDHILAETEILELVESVESVRLDSVESKALLDPEGTGR